MVMNLFIRYVFGTGVYFLAIVFGPQFLLKQIKRNSLGFLTYWYLYLQEITIFFLSLKNFYLNFPKIICERHLYVCFCRKRVFQSTKSRSRSEKSLSFLVLIVMNKSCGTAGAAQCPLHF